MKMSSSGFAPRRRQGGFIQGAILFALVIIAVVVAAFSLANRDSQSSADSEQARVNASFVLKVGNDIQTGVNRAVADGLQPTDISSKLGLAKTAPTGGLVLFDPTLKYMVRPQFPATALATASTAQPFTGNTADADGTGATATFAATAAGLTGVGGSDKEVVIKVPGLKKDVCSRINVTTNGKLVTDAIPTAIDSREGCYLDDTVYTYYRVIATDAGGAAT